MTPSGISPLLKLLSGTASHIDILFEFCLCGLERAGERLRAETSTRERILLTMGTMVTTQHFLETENMVKIVFILRDFNRVKGWPV